MSRADRGRGAASPAALGLLGLVALLLGTALVMVALVLQVPDPPGATASAVAPSDSHHGQPKDADPAPATSSAPAPAPHGEPSQTGASAGAEQGAAPTDDATTVAPLPASEPVAVRVPAIGVTSPLHPLGLTDDGTLEVPTGARVDEAAWYSGSPTPGETGPAVVEGHVTGPGGRPSVFFDLGTLEEGDLVEVDRSDGTTIEFEVYRVESHPKDRFPTVAVYGPTTGPELRLITCGGEFDEASGHHVDNTVVFARALEAGQD